MVCHPANFGGLSYNDSDMDSTSKTMYDALKDEIWEELGPLDPNWFDALMVKTDEENVSEQDNLRTFNQDGHFKAPFEKTAVDSQLFSTPKIFRHGGVQSPETEDEQFFSAEQETERSPWTVASPCLFGTAKEGMSEPKSYGHMQFQNGFALLDTPQKTSVDFAQHISESLGAQIHPDISWTSSLNTPPAVPSTLILSKNEESPCPASLSAEKNVIFVRKLFPSLTNESGVPAVSPNTNEGPSAHQAVDSPGPGQDRNSHESTESSLNQSNSDWKQTLPDAIEDGEIRSTVARVLDGAENVLSIFFTNSSSALRRVKTDRIKRKQSSSTKDHSYSSTNISTTNSVGPSERTAEQRTDDLEVGRVPSSPHLKSQVKAGNSGNTQWSPLSLSEISHCAVDTTSQVDAAKQIGSSVTAEQLGSDSVCGQLVRPSLINTDSMFTKKKRRFVYTIQSAKSHLQGKDMSTEMESSPGNPVLEQELYVTRMENAPDEAQCYNRSKQSCDGIHEMQKQENVAKEYLSPSVPTKSQDLDMSQLCRAFAQDFTPVPDSSKLSNVEDTHRNGFSPSACLSALRQRNKQKSDERVPHLDRNGISDKGNMPSTYLRKSKTDSTVSDSGFQSFMADVTPMTASSSVLPSIERGADSQPWPGFKTEIHRTAPFESATQEKGMDNMNRPAAAAELSTRVIEQSQTVDLGTETNLHTEGASSSAKAIVIERNCIQQNCQVPASVQPQTVSVLSVHASGFKTASNRGVKISKVNLERAKNLFKEINAETSIGHQPTRCSRNTEDETDISHISVESISNSNHPPSTSGKCGDLHCPLTASQKADVTELCSLLEEADSQFEFTQFRTAKQNQHSKDNASLSQTADKDLDPDFLSGIDFDDSFSSDAEKHVAKTMTPNKVTSISHCKMDCTAPSIKSKSSGTSLCNVVKKENPSSGHAFSRHMSEGLAGTAPTKLQSNFNIAGHTEAVKPENKNPSVFGVGFKTAGGNVLKVSNKYLSKARALFADLEENPLTISDTGDSSDIVTKNTEEVQKLPHQQKNCEISVKANHQHNVDNSTDNGDFLHSKEDSKFTGNHDLNTQERIQVCFSDVPESPFLDRHVPDIRTAEHATKMSKLENNKMDTSSCQSGFQMASGKGISVSAKAIQEASAFFKDCVAIDSEDCMSKHKKHITPVTGMVTAKKNISNFKGVKVNICDESVNGGTEFENVDAQTFAERHKEDEQILSGGYKNTLSLTNSVSFNGRPSLIAKQSSSLLYSSSKDAAFSNNGELSNAKGFCTPSGKKVSVSDDAVTKAKSLLSECHTFEDRSKHKQTADLRAGCQTSPIPTLPPQNGGFQTASGKGVAVSAVALKKAQALLSEYDGVEDEKEVRPEVRPILPNNPNADPPPRNNGFCTASGKKVSVSDDAMTKAKSLLNEYEGYEGRNQHQHAADSRAGCQTSSVPALLPQNGGFQTASGKGVAISTMALKKAQALLSEYDGVEDEKEVRPIPNNPICDPPPKDNGFCTASGKKVTVSDDAMTKAKSLLNEYDEFEDRNQHKQRVDTVRTHHLTNPVRASSLQNGGFQTASGKGVAVSAMALKKAKALLSDYDGVENEKELLPMNPNTPIHEPLPRNGGFSAASGKPVAFSAKALQKAEALFSDINSTTETPAVSDTWNTDSNHEDASKIAEKIHCTFTTARGTKVNVSEKNLLKAKNLLNEFVDAECPDSVITPRSYSAGSFDIHKSEIHKVNICKITSTSDLNTTSQKDMVVEEIVPQVVITLLSEADLAKEAFRNSTEGGYSLNAASGKSDFVSEKASKEAFRFQEGTGAPSGQDNLQVMPGEERPTIMDCGVNRTSGSETHQFIRTDGSSVLNFESLDISNCTDTQQLFFAQEAMDCTKALLEDEDLAGQSRNMISEKLPLHDNPKSSKESGETQKTSGKRSAKDSDMTGQPPLKRRLLEEFDRTVDSPRGSTLHPAKSCPDGVTTDRRVFKFSVSLHPNITRPHGDGKPYMETGLQKTEPLLSKPNPTPGESGPLHSKISVFVPPFQKKVKAQTVNSNVPKNKAGAPVFVPPFKKQRTAVTESSPLLQTTEEEIDNQGNEDTQTMALVDSGSLQSGENPPVGHGKKDSVAEASDRLSTNQEMIANFELARDMQDMRIRKKKRQTIRPLSGSLFLAKTSGVDRIRLKDAVNGQPPAQYTQKQLYGYGVHRHVTEITSDTAESFRFSFQQFFRQEVLADRGGVQLADGGWLIPRNDGTAGKEEFYRALCDSPGVDPKLISEDWVYNHYRWIVWKQASMERSFPATMAGLCLNPEQVLLQLKYRYDVEVDHSRRPALRKIMEKDDTAAKTLVLCVCGVVSRGHDPSKTSRNDIQTPQGADSKVENPVAVVWLTDGWYAIKAQLDVPLTAMLHKGRLAIGGKLIIHGAELVGSQDACPPLEAPESVMLKICANSSRPARWDTKLGFHRDPRPFLLPVSCLYSNGGTVGCVDIVILRSYPIQWMERKPDGGFVFRCDRAEEKEARRYNNSKHKAMEILFAKIQAEFEKEDKGNKPRGRRRTLSRQDIENLQDGEELHEAVENDPAYLEARLSEQQLETLHSYRRSLAEKKQAELQERYRRALDDAQESELNCPKRDVTPVWRLCIADSRDQLGSGVCLLSIWRPSTDLQSFIKEGCRYRVYNLTTSEGKRRAGFTSVQLTATKKTQFQDLQASQEWLSAHFQPRISANFLALQNPEFHPLCGEIDLVGHVIAIIDGQGSFPVLYLVDGKLKFVKVHCCSSLAQTGLEDVVKPLALLALSNLQLRAQSSSPIPTLYAGDLTVFSTNPKEAHLQEAVTQLRNLVQEHENFFTIAEERLSHFVRSDSLSSIPSPALQPRTPGHRTDRKPDTRTSLTFQQPARSFGSFTPLSRKTPPVNSSSEKDPKLLKRRRALEYLSHVPSPPPLCHLGTAAASPCVNKTFNPPRRSGTASTLKTAQTPVRKPVVLPPDDEWVNDEELAMIDTQALHGGDLSR
ncbi:breast cancer type 2 susceptibility protein isoform X2 [Myripristis murdjan]|uniref:breast cancer type 2 susceptibility protein isoform X2 n=1 Tax=Myripristis murdjan TaxID=586833 RepID=UPI001176256F|nr:breast cancer type 2 susceptibility protein isoform X2 [Myripristis murdjan]